MFGLGPMEIGVIVLVMLLLFGRRLPIVARDVGRSVVSFKRGLRDLDLRRGIESAVDGEPQGSVPRLGEKAP